MVTFSGEAVALTAVGDLIRQLPCPPQAAGTPSAPPFIAQGSPLTPAQFPSRSERHPDCSAWDSKVSGENGRKG